METLEQLQEKSHRIKQAIQGLTQLGLYSDAIKESLNEEDIKIDRAIIKKQTGRSPDTRMTVIFPEKNLIIEEDDSRVTFQKAIEAFGVENVYRLHPNWFLTKPEKNTDCIQVAPSRYLKAGLNNERKKKNLKRLQDELEPNVLVFFSLR